ncbi:MAG TPA: SGNH/GDSL hydrolase family protein, partial [Candidatus Dormibacteraeota bacterium]|nr:SGNH/GDSL hydrolase family protein [Candidatus Dormibacteraeota bacterium]
YGASQLERRPYRMLFVGASITAGVGAETQSQSFPYVLAGEVEKKVGQVRLTIIASSGAPVHRALPWRYPSGQDVIVVHLATNDFLDGTELPAYKSELETILQRFRAGSPHAAMVCLGTWSAPDAVNKLGLGPSAYDAIDKGDCDSVNGHFIPLQPLFEQPKLHNPAPLALAPRLLLGMRDVGGKDVAFHPSAAGHAAIAESVYDTLVQADALRPPTQMVRGDSRYA